jgi:hypothetical protein
MTGLDKKVLGNLVLGLAVLMGFGLSMSSCKEKQNPQADITVVDSTGKAVKDARVVLYCVQRPEETRECNIADTQFTDDVGKANFEFENPVVLKVDVWKEDVVEKDTGTFPNQGVIKVGDTLCTEGFITLETDEVTEQTFIVNLCNTSTK